MRRSPLTLRERLIRRLGRLEIIGRIIREAAGSFPMVIGDPARVHLGEGARVQNATMNTFSGEIRIGPFAFLGTNVSLLTGTHDMTLTGRDRQTSVPTEGHDIVIGDGVWVGSNATVIGPCTIGEGSVVAAGSVVTSNLPEHVLAGGVPARVLRTIAPRGTDPPGVSEAR